MVGESESGGNLGPWAHLADGNGENDPEIIDLSELAMTFAPGGVVWSSQSEDLIADLVVLEAGKEIPEHVDPAADRLLIGVSGEGSVNVDGQPSFIWPGTMLVIEKGTHRSIQATFGRFAYLACARRPGSQPTSP